VARKEDDGALRIKPGRTLKKGSILE